MLECVFLVSGRNRPIVFRAFVCIENQAVNAFLVVFFALSFDTNMSMF